MPIRSAVETITPEAAEKLLTASKDQVRNRKVLDSHVEWLAEQMKSGKWKTNGEPIILDDEGYLLDGQHRMYAVALSGSTIETVVTRGVDRSTFSTIDTGAGRTAASTLAIAGESNTPMLAAVLGWLYRYEMGKMLWATKGAGFTSAIGIGLLKKHSGVREEITWACTTGKSNIFLGKISPSVLAFLRYVFAQHKPYKAQEFFDLIGDIRPDQPGTPTRVLRDWVLKDERSRAPAETRELMAVIVKAWSAFLDSETPKTYVWRRTGATPESFPVFPGEKESRGKAIRGFEPKDGRKHKK